MRLCAFQHEHVRPDPNQSFANPATRRALLKLLQPLGEKSQIANQKSKIPRLRPALEAEIKFAEWTAGGVLRHAEFVTLREA